MSKYALAARIMAVASMVALLLTFSIPAFAADPVTVSVEAPECVPSGDTFDVNVKISAVNGFAASFLRLSYDETVLRMDGLSAGDIGGNTIFELSSGIPGEQAILLDPSDDASILEVSSAAEGTLCVLHFTAIGAPDSESDIGLSSGVIVKGDLTDIPATWEDGHVYVGCHCVCGDADKDGFVTTNDGWLIYMNQLFGDVTYPIECQRAADCDGSVGITTNDGWLIYMNQLFGDIAYPLSCSW